MVATLQEAIDELKKLKVKKVMLQLPEGLLTKSQEIADELEAEGFEVVICGEPAFGSCDLRDEEAQRLGCDALLHVGHSDFGVRSKVPVVYWEYFVDKVPGEALLDDLLEAIKDFKTIGLVTSVQYVKAFEKVKKFLEARGKRVVTRKVLAHEGQVLGCNVAAAKSVEDSVDAFVFVGAGKFHALGVALEVSKPVVLVDIELSEVTNLDRELKKFIKLLEWNKSALEEAKNVGLLVSWKKGQLNLKAVSLVKQKLENMGKKVYVLAFDNITPEKLEGLKLDLLVNLACPRIGIDDLTRYKVPLINYTELFKS